MKYNLNHEVRVTLDEHLARLFDERQDRLEIPDKFRVTYVVGETWRGPLWELMQVAGPQCYNGSAMPPLDVDFGGSDDPATDPEHLLMVARDLLEESGDERAALVGALLDGRLQTALYDARASLLSCYDTCDWPADGKTPQDAAARLIDAVLP